MISKAIIDSLRRADVFQYYDWQTDTVHLVSMNFDAPLTDDEKFKIVNHLTMRLFPLKVIFDN